MGLELHEQSIIFRVVQEKFMSRRQRLEENNIEIFSTPTADSLPEGFNSMSAETKQQVVNNTALVQEREARARFTMHTFVRAIQELADIFQDNSCMIIEQVGFLFFFSSFFLF